MSDEEEQPPPSPEEVDLSAMTEREAVLFLTRSTAVDEDDDSQTGVAADSASPPDAAADTLDAVPPECWFCRKRAADGALTTTPSHSPACGPLVGPILPRPPPTNAGLPAVKAPPKGPPRWGHLQCVLWSSEVVDRRAGLEEAHADDKVGGRAEGGNAAKGTAGGGGVAGGRPPSKGKVAGGKAAGGKPAAAVVGVMGRVSPEVQRELDARGVGSPCGLGNAYEATKRSTWIVTVSLSLLCAVQHAAGGSGILWTGCAAWVRGWMRCDVDRCVDTKRNRCTRKQRTRQWQWEKATLFPILHPHSHHSPWLCARLVRPPFAPAFCARLPDHALALALVIHPSNLRSF